jgi:LPS export ABC transporter protein LptC
VKIPGPVALVFLVGLAAGSWWLASRTRDETAATTVTRAGQPGYYLNGAMLEQTDETGRVELRVTAANAVQDPASRIVRAESLTVEYFLDAPRTWVMTSRTGELPQDGQIIKLQGDVRLTGGGMPGGVPAVIRTDHLTLDVDRSIASTRDPVRIEMGKNAVTARGLHADLKTDRLRLESNVNGRYTR